MKTSFFSIFSGYLGIVLCTVVLTFDVWMKSLTVTIQIKDTGQFFLEGFTFQFVGEILKCGNSNKFSRLCFDPEIKRFTVFSRVCFLYSDQWPARAKNVSDNGNRFIHAKVGRPVIIQLCAWS